MTFLCKKVARLRDHTKKKKNGERQTNVCVCCVSLSLDNGEIGPIGFEMIGERERCVLCFLFSFCSKTPNMKR